MLSYFIATLMFSCMSTGSALVCCQPPNIIIVVAAFEEITLSVILEILQEMLAVRTTINNEV